MKIIQIKAKPNARTSELKEMEDGTWLASVKATPVDGKANKELIALVAQHFKVSKSSVTIKNGASSRFKRVVIE